METQSNYIEGANGTMKDISGSLEPLNLEIRNSQASMDPSHNVKTKERKKNGYRRDSAGKQSSSHRSSIGSMNKYLRHNMGEHTKSPTSKNIEPIRRSKVNSIGSQSLDISNVMIDDIVKNSVQIVDINNEQTEEDIKNLLNMTKF